MTASSLRSTHPAAQDDSWRGGAEIHISDVAAYKACRRAWNWSSRLRGNLEPIRPYHAFFFGRAIHYTLERYYAGETNWEEIIVRFVDDETKLIKQSGAIWEQEQGMINEQTEMAFGMIKHYLAWEARQSGPFTLRNLEFITLEQEFACPIWNPFTGEIMPDAFFAGKWDGLVRRRDNGDIYIWELKTSRSIPQRAALLPNDDQATEYLNAAKYIFGDAVKGLLYTIMAKRVPPFPKVLDSGRLSSDVRSQTFDSFYAAIQEHYGERATKEFIATHYGPELLKLHGTPNTFFERHVVTRNEHALDLGMANLYSVASEMIDPNTPTYPSPGFHCAYCLFNAPCVALQNDTLSEITLVDHYRPRSAHGVVDGEGIES